jgi:2-polyprenyl-3-methyl-5-hydroxy-6-metoxy-1,4-benzoquinol methylase
LTNNLKLPEPVLDIPSPVSTLDFDAIREEIQKRKPFAMQIDVHGVPTQQESQMGITVIDGQTINYGYHPLNLWEAIHRPLIKDISGKKVLDVGCNSGFFSFELAKRGADVLGVDVNQVERVYNLDCMPLQQAEWIESQLQTGAKFKEMDYLNCDESEPYDKILFLGVYYHLEDPSRGLAKLNRLLKMGGELYVESETHPVETRYYPDDEPYRLDASNFLIPTSEYLNKDLERNGFKIVETFRTRDVCCGRRYAVRAVKVSDNPQPENTYLGAKTTSAETFTFSPRKSFQWGA